MMNKYISAPLRACIVNDFVLNYNKNYFEDWTVEIDTPNNRVDIFRPSVGVSTDGHFVGKLVDFCRDTFNATPCVGYVFGRLEFWI